MGENLTLALFCENTYLGDKASSQLWFYVSYLSYLNCIIHPHSLEFHKYFFFLVLPPATKGKKTFRKVKQPYLNLWICFQGEEYPLRRCFLELFLTSRSHGTNLHLQLNSFQITKQLMRAGCGEKLGLASAARRSTPPFFQNLDYHILLCIMCILTKFLKEQ